jgi:hypothetical protein
VEYMRLYSTQIRVTIEAVGNEGHSEVIEVIESDFSGLFYPDNEGGTKIIEAVEKADERLSDWFWNS